MAEVVVMKLKFLPLFMSGFMLLSVILPYIVAIARSNVEVFLPYISHAAAFPPQSALLSIFMAIAALLGVVTFCLRFVAVEHKRNRLDPRKIRNLNTASLVAGCAAVISMLLASHFSLGHVTHNKHDWVRSVVIPHFVSTGSLITMYTVYVLIQAYLTYVQRKKSSSNVFVHAFLSMCIVITNWTTCLPFFAAVREMLPNIIDSETGKISLESKEYSFYYIISSLSEWAFTFFSLLFIATFYQDLKRMKVTVRVRRKPITHIHLDTVHSAFSEEVTKM